MPENKVIVEAILTPENKIEVICKSTHIPSLSYIIKILDAYVIELITLQKLKQEIKDAPKIVIPSDGKHHGIIDFVRRGFRR